MGGNFHQFFFILDRLETKIHTMKNLFTIIIGLVILVSCKSVKPQAEQVVRPAWVEQRPVNGFYYTGIGFVSKSQRPYDYQQIAKKNALDDLLGEIKVNVSSNSILSQYQNNQNFSQQYFSDVKLVASETVENFEVVSSWENKEQYWIYYRLSKSEFEAQRRKKRDEAVSKAISLLQYADAMETGTQFVNQFRARVRALVAVQQFLNESVEGNYKGKQVFLINEIINQLQDQLIHVQIKANPDKLKAIIAKALPEPIQVNVKYGSKSVNEKVINGFPLKFYAEASGTKATTIAETQSGGNAIFGVSKVSGNQGVQLYKIKADLERLIKVDSIFNSTRQLLMNLDVPSASIVIDVQPIKVFIKSDELNLGEPLQIKIIEPALKKRLGDLGCSFVKNEANADYKISISTSTKDLGVMWGSMLQSGIELQIIVEDLSKDSELFKDNLQGIKGYQITKERAGIEAYNNLMIDFNKKIYPHLRAAILQE
jgi:hypothetical protein